MPHDKKWDELTRVEENSREKRGGVTTGQKAKLGRFMGTSDNEDGYSIFFFIAGLLSPRASLILSIPALSAWCISLTSLRMPSWKAR